MREARFQKMLTIALSVENYQSIKHITDELRISMAEWLRILINEKLKTEQDKKSVSDNV
ncbi:MAG: hypothetical protein V1872_05525 [bacterium]